MKKFIALSLSNVVFIMLINIKMPAIVGILTFMSRINFVLSSVEPEKSFITSVHGLGLQIGVFYQITIFLFLNQNMLWLLKRMRRFF